CAGAGTPCRSASARTARGIRRRRRPCSARRDRRVRTPPRESRGPTPSPRRGRAPRSRGGRPSIRSSPPSQKFTDAGQDAVLVGDVGGHQLVAVGEALVEIVLELSRAVGAFHLPVAEEVRLGEELLVEQAQALGGVASGPVVAVG